MAGRAGSSRPLRAAVDDGAEIAQGACLAAAAGFDDAGQESKGAGPFFGAGAVAEVARNHPVSQRLFGGVVRQRQMGLVDRAQDYLPVVQEFAGDAAQHLVVIRLVRLAWLP